MRELSDADWFMPPSPPLFVAQGVLSSAALKLPGRDPMNAGVALACLGGMGAFVAGPSSPEVKGQLVKSIIFAQPV